MSFHDAWKLEIAVEFSTLSGGSLWDRIEDGFWLRRQREHAAWAEHGQWWRKTTLGRKHEREYARVRAARLQRVVVAVAACKGCGKPFPRTAYDAARKRGRVCSPECRGRARGNIELITIDRQSLPLARWAERYGVPLKTVCKRRKLGWGIVRALTTPVLNRGQKTQGAGEAAYVKGQRDGAGSPGRCRSSVGTDGDVSAMGGKPAGQRP